MKTATFKITEDDYMAAIRLHSRMPRSLRLIWCVLVIIVTAGAVFGPDDTRVMASITLVCNLLAFFGLPLFVRLVSRGQYRNYRAIQAEFSATLHESGLHLKTEFGESRVTWANVLKWRHNEQYLLLYLAPRLFHVVPKSIAAQGFDFVGLLESLKAYVGPAR